VLQLLFHFVKESLCDLACKVLSSDGSTDSAHDSSMRTSLHAKFGSFNRSEMSTGSLSFPDHFSFDEIFGLFHPELLHGHESFFDQTVIPAILSQIGQSQNGLAELIGAAYDPLVCFFVKIVDDTPESNEQTSNQVEVSLQNVECLLVTPATGPDLVILLFNNDQVLFDLANVDFILLVLVDVVGDFVLEVDFLHSVEFDLEQVQVPLLLSFVVED